VLYTGGALKMMVSVDELDIESVALGQSATVTLDAFPDEKFAGSVTRISNVGETAKSVATFSVELTLDADARLKLGMNGNATILVDQATDALILPIAAISEDADGAYVYVGDELVKTYITTGLSDGTNAVVTGGLSEGDVVKYASGMTMYETLQTLSSQFRNSARNRGN
jgi:HlyD family secretion protein